MKQEKRYYSKMYVGVPPGLGDIYWILTKLESYREQNDTEELILAIYSSNISATSGVKVRSKGISDLVDFVDGDEQMRYDHKHNVELPQQKVTARVGDIPTTYVGPMQVMWANAFLKAGGHLRDFMPQFETNFDFKIHNEPFAGANHPIVIYPSSVAINKAWLKLDIGWWADLIFDVIDSGHQPVIIGAEWDVEMWGGIKRWCEAMRRPLDTAIVDLVGKTTLPQVLGVIERAGLLIGAISGMTIMGNHYRVPTLALYPGGDTPGPQRFIGSFPYSWVPDASLPYYAVDMRDKIRPKGILQFCQQHLCGKLDG